ncbi:hypothetical protein [Proteiniclasticum ruminis]|uniref:Uncharacterized protein n=1 Tax=Proteiniclasticum ruminis TaxID=398199 RepID=A0A1G8GI00_9CLOT|nr:hypothetical protein [Proteiniclasticum ruminis]SDH93897.1 hypothetical protein SAMN05421804_101268 [Proteiniclasticum ruminis]
MVRPDYRTLQSLEELLEMKSGYVLDFSNRSFETFVKEITGINIYNDKGYEEYASKANKLRQFICF